MRTFYEEALTYKYGPDFSFLYRYSGRMDITAYDLLHGYCNVFAKAVNEVFGYRIFSIIDEYGTLIHCYARTEENGKAVYVDVRGKTESYRDLISEFEDWTTEEDSLRNTKAVDPEEIYVPNMSHTEAAYDLSLEMIEMFTELYQVPKEKSDADKKRKIHEPADRVAGTGRLVLPV